MKNYLLSQRLQNRGGVMKRGWNFRNYLGEKAKKDCVTLQYLLNLVAQVVSELTVLLH